MNMQYISDNKGETTGVYIPIQEWNELKSKYMGIEEEENNIPDWHNAIVKKRYEDYLKNPGNVLDFDSALNEVEEEL